MHLYNSILIINIHENKRLLIVQIQWQNYWSSSFGLKLVVFYTCMYELLWIKVAYIRFVCVCVFVDIYRLNAVVIEFVPLLYCRFLLILSFFLCLFSIEKENYISLITMRTQFCVTRNCSLASSLSLSRSGHPLENGFEESCHVANRRFCIFIIFIDNILVNQICIRKMMNAK